MCFERGWEESWLEYSNYQSSTLKSHRTGLWFCSLSNERCTRDFSLASTHLLRQKSQICFHKLSRQPFCYQVRPDCSQSVRGKLADVCVFLHGSAFQSDRIVGGSRYWRRDERTLAIVVWPYDEKG